MTLHRTMTAILGEDIQRAARVVESGALSLGVLRSGKFDVALFVYVVHLLRNAPLLLEDEGMHKLLDSAIETSRQIEGTAPRETQTVDLSANQNLLACPECGQVHMPDDSEVKH